MPQSQTFNKSQTSLSHRFFTNFFPLICLLLSSLYLSLAYSEPSPLNTPKTIAIAQIAAHPALDEVRLGLLETLQARGFQENRNLTVYYDNAFGDLGLSTQIASKYLSLPIDVLIGISTPSTQSLFFLAQKRDKQIPIVFTAVTDPSAAKLDPKPSHYPMTGLTDAPPLEALIKLMNKALPHLTKVGVIYNPSEINSTIIVKKFKTLLEAQQLELMEAPVTKTQDISAATKSLIGKVDAVYLPQDNMVVSGIATIVGLLSAQHLPSFSNDPSLVPLGVTGAVGINYRQLGRKTGKIVVEILQGKDARLIPIQSTTTYETVINKEALKKYKSAAGDVQ